MDTKVDAHISEAASNKTATDTAISNNTTAINALTTRATTSETNISVLRNDVDALSASVDELSTIKADLTIVNQNIETISEHAATLSALDTAVNHLDEIKASVETVQTNAANIAANLNQITTNTNNISTLTNTVDGHGTSISTISSNVSTLQSKMMTAEENIDNHSTRISAVEVKASDNETDIADLTTVVAGHTDAIAALNTKDASLDTDITNINLALDQKATKSELQDAKALITTAQSTADAANGLASEAKVLATNNAESLSTLTGTVASKANSTTVNAINDRVNTNETNIANLQSSVASLSSTKANKSEIPDVSNFATRDELPTDYATQDALATVSSKVDELETLKADLAVVTANADNIAALSEAVNSLDELKASVTSVETNAAAVQENATKIAANLANITANTEAVSALTGRVSTLEGAGHLTAATLPSHLKGLVAVDGVNVSSASHDIVTKKNDKNITAKIWNETSGGGAQMKNEDAGKISFVGVNNGDGDKEIWVQAYAKKISNNTGVRMTLTTDKMYYTKNQANGNYTDGDEIVTVKDLPEVPSIEGLASETYVDNKVDSIVIPDISNLASKDEVAVVDAKVDALVIPSIDGLATEQYVNNKVAAIEIPSVEGLASETYVDEVFDTIDLSPYVEKAKVSGLVAIDGTNVSKAEHNIVSKKNNKNITAKIWNETSGGGAQMKNENVGKISFIGVNNGDGDNEIWVQGYAKNIGNNTGTRMTLSTTGMYYTKNQNNGTYTANDEIVTVKDLNAAVGAIVIPDISGLAEKSEIPSIAGLATEQYVNNAVGSIVIPSVDGLASVTYVDEQIAAIEHPVEGLATTAYVDTAISNIDIPSTEGLASETYVNDAVGAIDIPDVSGISTNTGDVAMLLTRLASLENQLKAMKQTSVQSVDINSAESSTLINNTADFVCSDTAVENKVVTVSGKSIDISDTEITSGRLALAASEDVELTDISSSGNLAKSVSNAAVSINNNGYVKITDNNFAQTGYNSIEIGLTAANAPKGVLIDNCTFGEMSNNTISIFNTVDNAVVTISNCYFGKSSNPIRISNRNNVRMTLNLINCTFEELELTYPEYRGIIICQDYTATNAAMATEARRFGPDKITVNVINCIDPTGNKIVQPEDMSQILGSQSCANPLIYVYYDKGGLQPYSAEVYPAVHIS